MTEANGPSPDSRREAELDAILAEYLEAARAGRAPDRDEIVALHPHLAGELRSFLAAHERIERIAAPLRQPVTTPAGIEGSATMPVGAARPPTPEGTVGEAPPPGTRVRYVGDYELLEELARGGMGVVYRARQVSLERIVALKMILAGRLAGDEEVERFRREAQAAASLHHPAIVGIHEVGEHEGQHYFSMDYIEGESLAERVREGPLPVRRAAELARTIAEAVQYAHDNATLHRDLKPSNVLLDAEGNPHITDFGLARRLDAGTRLTASGAVLGTPSYMPPEQALGRVDRLGPAADVYSLGAVLYELLTGRPPFQAETPVDTIMQVIEDDPVSPRLLNPKVSRDLETIVLACLAKDPAARYARAADLAADLDAFLAGRPVRARRPGLVERGARWLRRQRRSVALTLLAAAVTGTLLAGGLLTWLGYREWRLGFVSIDTDAVALVADVLGGDGRPATARIGVPTQEPVPIPAGSYRLRVSGRRVPSATFEALVERGVEQSFEVSLEERRLWKPISIAAGERRYLVDLAGHADLVIAAPGGVRRLDGASGAELWRTAIGREDTRAGDLAGDLAGVRWAWGGRSPSLERVIERRPRLLRPAPDLDGDGVRDLVFALRHEAALVALSGAGGGVLWARRLAPPREGGGASATSPATKSHRFAAATTAAALAVGDLDGDAAADLIVACAALLRRGGECRRWVEAVSGRSGTRLWSRELDRRWFEPVPPRGPCAWIPRSYGWGSGGAAPRASSGFVYPPRIPPGGWGDLYRRKGGFGVEGETVAVPGAVDAVTWEGGDAVLVVAGTRLLVLEARAGNELRSPVELGFVPVCAPRAADLDGDGLSEVVCLATRQAPDEQFAKRALGSSELVAVSLRSGRALWRAELAAEWGAYTVLPRDEPPRWPLVVDLDVEGDGRPEIVVAHGVPSRAHDVVRDHGPPGSGVPPRLWGGVRVLEGRDGATRWHRVLRTLDEEVDRMICGPDIDGDGRREIFTASLVARGASPTTERLFLFVDALSGADGHSLWAWSEKLRDAPRDIEGSGIGPLAWWQRGPDGRRELLVSYTPRQWRGHAAVYALETGTGRLLHAVADPGEAATADLDGDGVLDLVSLRATEWAGRGFLGGAAEVTAFRGADFEWRRLGTEWQAAADFDGDGATDLLGTAPRRAPRFAAVSGHDGHLLWRSPVVARGFEGTPAHAFGSLDGDGVDDIVTWWPSVAAFSGSDGRRLWRLASALAGPHRFLERRRRAAAVDLDGDGRDEVLLGYSTSRFVYELREGTSREKHYRRMHLACLDGATGVVRWRADLGAETLAQLDGLDLPIHAADLDGDGAREVLTAALAGDAGSELVGCALVALDGRDGRPLWRHALAPRENHFYLLRNLPAPAVVDLDGDGRREVILCEYRWPAGPDVVTARRTMQVVALDGTSGDEKVLWEAEVGPDPGRASDEPGRRASRPVPLPVVLAAGSTPRHGLCVWAWGTESSVTFRTDNGVSSQRAEPAAGLVAVLDASGRELWRAPVPAGEHGGENAGVFGVRAGDLDGDGADEILYPDRRTLVAVRAATGKALWRRGFDARPEVIDVELPEDAFAGAVAVRTGRKTVSLAPRTGAILWRAENIDGMVPPALLRCTAGDRLPRLVFAGGGTTLCRRPFVTGAAATSKRTSWPVRAAALPAPSDPRVLRPLPYAWLFAPPAALAYGAALALLIFVVPAFLLVRALGRRPRRWAPCGAAVLGTLAALGAAAAVAATPWARTATGCAFPLGDLGEAVLGPAVAGLAGVAFPVLAALWAARGRWRRVVVFVALHLVMLVTVALVLFVPEAASRESWEHYDWSDWYLGIVDPLWATGLAAVAFVVVVGAWHVWKTSLRSVRRRVHRPAPSSSGGRAP